MDGIYINKHYNVLNPLEGKIDTLIDVFVKYYGEDKRDIITQKINNTTFVFAPKLSGEVRLEDRLNNFFDDLIINECNIILQDLYAKPINQILTDEDCDRLYSALTLNQEISYSDKVNLGVICNSIGICKTTDIVSSKNPSPFGDGSSGHQPFLFWNAR